MSWADMVRLDLDPASSFADRVKARIQARRAELRPVQGAWGKTPVV
jgi:hypothetical protein